MSISIDDFKKLEIKIGQILSAEKIDGSTRLLKLFVDMGEENPRQVVSGISVHFPEPDKLVGKKCAFASNLEPRSIMGFESQGMILAVSGIKPQDGSLEDSVDQKVLVEQFFSLLETGVDVPGGSIVK